MKTILRLLSVGLLFPLLTNAQITTPVIRANFGVDADLRSNFFNGLVQSGNDDWFRLPGSAGTGEFVIDTNGAAAIVAGYTANANLRKLPFYRTMRFPAYKVVNNRLLVDAVFVRDYHGDDSTVFASGSNKNGMSPQNWTCPVSQSIPDKNEILDMMLHVRRAGPNTTDSLWMFGGVSIENTTGNRYFDFEMYQTDIYYDRASRRFYNYGPDAGHTTWKFDASGNMVKPGDIILTAEYGSSSLTAIEARIWINKNDLSITPAGFNWTGSFDGASAGAQFGYAGIQPKTAGTFYTGLQSVNNTWAGPFSLVLGDNSVVTNYVAKQYMEFSVNLSKLGLDQAQIFGGDDCQMPFRRVIVKTRSSTSFTAELKDFVAPFDFFLAPRADVETNTPVICDTGSISQIYVTNPIATSQYVWSTPNGRIVGSNIGTSIYVDTPGVYIVYQYLQAGCSVYATDTITIGRFENCHVLVRNMGALRGFQIEDGFRLSWSVVENQHVDFFEIEASKNGRDFYFLDRLNAQALKSGYHEYKYHDALGNEPAGQYYRVRMSMYGNFLQQSNVVFIGRKSVSRPVFEVFPNPVTGPFKIKATTAAATKAEVSVFNQLGISIVDSVFMLQPGENVFTLDVLDGKPPGIYRIRISYDGNTMKKQLLKVR